MAAHQDVLTARDVTLKRGSKHVLAGTTLTLRSGEPPVGLIGESATGKSTLAQILAGKLRPTTGTVTLNNRKVVAVNPRDKKYRETTVRYIPQNGIFTPDESVLTGTKLMRTAFTKARRAGRETGLDAQTLFDVVGLAAHDANRPVNHISGGQRQRLALAVALATRPRILILDEPVTALDEPSRRAVTADVFTWCAQAGTAILLISHDLPLVEQFTQTVQVLAHGHIVESGPLRQLLDNPQHEVTRSLAAASGPGYVTSAVLRG